MRKLYFFILFIVCALVSNAQRAPVAVNDVASIYENGTVLINVIANDSNFNPQDTVCITALYGGQTGWAAIANCTDVLFHPLNPTFVGYDTFHYISCDQQITNLCDTGQVIVTIKVRAPKAINDSATMLAGDTLILYVLANDSNFNPQDSVRITTLLGSGATGWAVILDSTKVQVVSPSPYYFGLDTFHYRSCDTHTGLCDTGFIFVNVIRAPRAFVDSGVEIQPDTSYIFPLANDSDLNILDSACLTAIWGGPANWASIQDCGQIAFDATNLNYAGKDTFYYSSCYTNAPVLCDTGMIVVTVILPVPQVDFMWTEDSPCVAIVYNNSILADSVIWTVQYLTDNGTNDTLYNVSQFPVSSNEADSGFDVEVCLKAFNPSGDSTVCYTFWIQCTYGNDAIKTIADSHLIIYPDPAADIIQLNLSKIDPALLDNGSSITIYDMVGQQIRILPIGETGSGISVSDLSPGMYLISLTNGTQSRRLLGKFEVMR